MLRQEMDFAYFNFIHRPGEKLGVLDNASDFECCAERVHCNATHDNFTPRIVWNKEGQCYVLDASGIEERDKKFKDIIEGRRHVVLSGGDHNNVYFPGFYEYRNNIPEALMRDIDGHYLELRDKDILGGKPIPMPAIDDPTILKLNAEAMMYQAALMPGCHHVIGYTMGGEMLYPEYFGLGNGDYRSVSWKHFGAWCKKNNLPIPEKKETLIEDSEARRKWLMFREQAMADRAAYYYQSILKKDSTHLCYYPTHGSMTRGTARAMLSQQPDKLTAACDGIEMGHIMVDDDKERRNVILTTLNTSYGTPVIVPRLGNKTADLSAAGGGRSFTPETLRRYVFEDVGMGISTIYPIHWRSHLHDGEWFIKDTPAEAECRKVFDEIVTAAPYLMGMGRLQPQLGVLAADDTWLKKWNPLWTAFMQDALTHHVYATIMTDSIIQRGLAEKMPVLLLLENRFISDETIKRLIEYMDEGGKAILWGEFAVQTRTEDRQAVLNHKNCLMSQIPRQEKKRVIREMFLTGMFEGTFGERYLLQPVEFLPLIKEIETFVPNAILRPFEVQEGTGVNLYPLTDRAGLGCICINQTNKVQTIDLVPNEKLLSDSFAIDILTGLEIDNPLSIEAHGTLLVYFATRPTDDYEERICQAEDAYERWKCLETDIGALRHNFSNMRSGEHIAKRTALAEALLHSLALKCSASYSKEDQTMIVTANVFDADGNTVRDAALSMRIVPGTGTRYWLEDHGNAYTCKLDAAMLPKVYNPEKIDYLPLRGAVRMVFQAETKDAVGGCLLNIMIDEEE